MKRLTTLIKKHLFLLSIILIVVFGLYAARSLFIDGFYSSHDGVSHVVRLANFYKGIADGQIIPKWSNTLAFGLGSPVLMYYGPLPYLTGLIPVILGSSLSFSVEIVTALSLVLSGVFFFLWGRESFGEKGGLIGALFYMWAPYRFVDVYVRGAYPENFAFIFPPLIFLSIRKIFEKREGGGFILGVLSLSGIILSHNVMAIMFASVSFLYALGYLLTTKAFKRFFVAASVFASSFLVTSFYWVPAFFEKKEVYLDNLDASSSFLSNFVRFREILYSKWGWGPLGSTSPMSLQIGAAQLLLAVIAMVAIFLILKRVIKMKKVLVFHLVFFVLLFILSLFLMARESLFIWENLPLISFVLYPWRFLAMGVFAAATLASWVVGRLKPKSLFIVLFLGLLLYSQRNYTQLVGKIYEDDSFYYNYRDTADIWGEYLPKTADLSLIEKCREKGCSFERVEFTRKDVVVRIDAEKSNLLSFEYEGGSDLEGTINTFYFPGWNIYLDGSLLQDFKLNKAGTIDVSLPKGKHQVSLKFEDTDFRKMAVLLSISGIGFSVLYYKWLKKYLKK